jgi:hypothetical protein
MDSILVADTSMGLMKAFHFLIQQGRREPKKRFNYTPFGSAVHAARYLTKAEHAAVDKIVGELRTLDPSKRENQDRVKELMKEISAQPVKFVPIKREVRVDTSKKYPYRSKKRGG